jgi:hypothetical protein
LAEFTEEQLKYLIWRVNGLLEQYSGRVQQRLPGRTAKGPVDSDSGANRTGENSTRTGNQAPESDDGTD